MDGAGWATEHANWIGAMHAGIGDHIMIDGPAMADEARVVVVAFGAGVDTGVAADATVQINEHRRRAVDVTVLDDAFEEIEIDITP